MWHGGETAGRADTVTGMTEEERVRDFFFVGVLDGHSPPNDGAARQMPGKAARTSGASQGRWWSRSRAEAARCDHAEVAGSFEKMRCRR